MRTDATDGNMDIKLSGTKERIFDVAINLIAKNGFENVTIRDIGKEVGFEAPSMYYHFTGKEDLLDTIYRYFAIHRLDNRNAVEHIKATIETGSALDIVTVLSDSAFEFEEKKAVRMVLITKIILMRIYQDAKANQFFLHDWYETDISHLRKWLGYAVEIGRLPEDFDVEHFSIFFWRQLIMMAVWAFAEPGYEVRVVDEEKHLLKMFAGLLPLGEPLIPR